MLSRVKHFLRGVMARCLARVLPRSIMRDERYFDLWQARGYHVMPVSFYNPIPDTSDIPPEHFDKVFDLVGIDLREAAQVALFQSFHARFLDEVSRLTTPVPQGIDWFMLHGMVRTLRPAQVIEIGSGASTEVTAAALALNAEEAGFAGQFTAIEPFPSDTLRRGFAGLDKLLDVPVQKIPLTMFEALGPNDLLFIDSSHMVKIGSDAQYEFLEILPRLQPGVVVHVHDIFFPHDYGRDFILRQKAFWNEQYILQAFLAFNRTFRVDWCSSWMMHRHGEMLAGSGIAGARRSARPGSLWMRRMA